MNISEKNIVRDNKQKSESALIKDLKKESLLVSLAMMREGKTHESYQAMRVFEKLR